MAELKTIFLIFHIIFAGIAIAQVPVAIYFKRAIRNAAGQPGELSLMATMGQMLGFMGTGGGIGLLVTGLGLVATTPYSLLGLDGKIAPHWLIGKQVIYIIILLIVMLVLTPMAKRSASTLMAAGRSGQALTDALREEFFKTERISLVINLLVFINIVLGVWKPSAT